MDLEKIDPEGKLYVLRSGKGFSCYGWTVLDRKARAVAAWLAAPSVLKTAGFGSVPRGVEIQITAGEYRAWLRADRELAK